MIILDASLAFMVGLRRILHRILYLGIMSNVNVIFGRNIEGTRKHTHHMCTAVCEGA